VARELAEWRRAHPKATLTEIEDAVYEAMQQLQARALGQVVHASAVTDVAAQTADERPRCPTGFFPAEQNRRILAPERIQAILQHTPEGRLGDPQELVGALVWLASERAAGFVTGALICVHGGFSAMTI
jgi:NAD(P)-dependent dehydrogenase (short-subunit alcohol dehydrogenase family)